MLKTFIKKPVKIQEVQLIGTNYDEIHEFIGYFPVLACLNSKPYITINTLEGDH